MAVSVVSSTANCLRFFTNPIFAWISFCCALAMVPPPVWGASAITGIWANDGGDKVTQDELRVSHGTQNLTGKVLNRAWNGHTITLTGAANEVVSFNLVLEAATTTATQVSVTLPSLSSPGGSSLSSVPAHGDGVFNWVNRPIELFYMRYLAIHGLSYFSYGKWDERQVPTRFQRPWTGAGVGQGGWTDRPDHDKNYPDILVPLELVPTFAITAGQNQSIWGDIYIPKTTLPGVYTGLVSVSENGTVTHTVPVQLTVQNFALPDTPTLKTMVYLDTTDIEWRYVSGYKGYTNWQTPGGQQIANITDKYFELFHRHKISVFGQNECQPMDQPCDSSLPRLTGSLFTAANGYDGPGVGVGTGIFIVGPYGTWGYPSYGGDNWRTSKTGFWNHTNSWVSWFSAHLPSTDYALYLEDEPPASDYSQINTWTQWLLSNPGPGQKLPSLVTHSFLLAQTDLPEVDIPTTAATVGGCPNQVYPCDSPTLTEAAAQYERSTPGHKLWLYNDNRPATGTALTEDDGVAMRVLAWSQYKEKVDRWFYWYANVNSPVDWFQQATTWGTADYFDPVLGEIGTNGASNGNGLLVYPGSTVYSSQTNYQVNGPVASLRLKEWRRGIQDGDYLTLAAQYDPATVQSIVNRTLPSTLWEYQTNEPDYYLGGVSWSVDPDAWESARAALAQIISNHCASLTTTADPNSPCQGLPSAASAPSSDPPSTNPAPSNPASVSPVASGPAPLLFVPVTPCRVVDTRLPTSSLGGPSLAADTARTFPLPDGPCALPANVKAYALNVTVIPAGPLAYLTVAPAGQSLVGISTLNAPDGRTKANAAILAAGTSGAVTVYSTAKTEVILDVTGYFVSNSSSALAFYPVSPCRLVDTRLSPSSLGGPSLLAHQTRQFPLSSASCSVPSTAQAYSLNYTVIPQGALDWLNAWASNTAQPPTSLLNAPTGTVTANAAITPMDASGNLTVYASDNTDLLVDINGYYATPNTGGLSFYELEPCRSYDSRTLPGNTSLQGLLAVDLTTSSCGVSADSQVIVMNATALPAGPVAYLSFWPASQTNLPGVSTLNAVDGQVTSNLAVVPATQGAINAYFAGSGQLILDVFGYFAP